MKFAHRESEIVGHGLLPKQDWKQGDLAKARADYDAALKLDPKLAGSLYGRGLLKLKQGDKAGGDADIAAAKAIDAGIVQRAAKWGLRP